MITKRYCFIGKVQGVGFRYRVLQIASEIPIRGWAKNLDNGQVELVVKGDKENIAHLVAEINKTMTRNISHVEQEDIEDFPCDTFEIKY